MAPGSVLLSAKVEDKIDVTEGAAMSKKAHGDSGSYEGLRDRVKDIKSRGQKAVGPNDRERADWAYGNTKMENEAITRGMAKRAVEKRKPNKR